MDKLISPLPYYWSLEHPRLYLTSYPHATVTLPKPARFKPTTDFSRTATIPQSQTCRGNVPSLSTTSQIERKKNLVFYGSEGGKRSGQEDRYVHFLSFIDVVEVMLERLKVPHWKSHRVSLTLGARTTASGYKPPRNQFKISSTGRQSNVSVPRKTILITGMAEPEKGPAKLVVCLMLFYYFRCHYRLWSYSSL
jgi:hypothetical protein